MPDEFYGDKIFPIFYETLFFSLLTISTKLMVFNIMKLFIKLMMDLVAGPSAAAHVANLEWMRPARPRGGAPPRPYSLHPRRAGIWIWPPDSSARLSTRCGAPRARRHWRCRGHRSSRCPAAADHRARRQRVAQLRAPVHAGRLRPPEARAAQHSTAAAAARAAAAMDGDREPLRRVG